ncbi:uncharacterized protein LOC131006338 [Salvia miltiorrhiza]|uniref:uncharacterized protein LOC131006338 n=1 Tax=Salvia miltiorrhiza TaxID=226208 RepID=UPI0025ACE497|nr:uncharacterized protein LOC131006338 [Salvia miltiorrhiza]
MGVKAAKVQKANPKPVVEQSEEEKMKVQKYMRVKAADLGELQDKKLKGQLAVREELYGRDLSRGLRENHGRRRSHSLVLRQRRRRSTCSALCSSAQLMFLCVC